MPKLLRISDYAKSGLNSDLMPWDLPASFLTEIRNVRIITGKLSPFGGHSLWVDLPVDFNPGYLMHVGSISGQFWMIPGADAVYVYDGAAFSDISSAGGYASIVNPDFWSGCELAQIPIINHPDHYPEYWPNQSGGTRLELLPWDATQTWADVGETCKIMRSHKQFLFALNLVSGGQEITDGVRWSSPADIGGIPATWDHLDITNVAGLTNLGGGGGQIIDGLPLRDAFCIYQETGITVFDYIGGQFIWRIRHLSTTVGLISTNALVEVKARHYFIGDGDILVNDGNSIQSLLHNRMRRRFASAIDPDNYANSYIVKNNVASEIWFCVPEAGHTYPNVAYIYNWRDDSISVRDIPEAPFANYGPQDTSPLTWDTITGKWDESIGTWNQGSLTPLNYSIIAATKPTGPGTSGELLLLDFPIDTVVSDFDTNIERISFALEGLDQVTTMTRIYPHMRGPGDVWIQVGSQDHPGSPIRWRAAEKFNADLDRKLDVRTTGELHCFRFFSKGGNVHWDLSGIDIEYQLAGVR